MSNPFLKFVMVLTLGAFFGIEPISFAEDLKNNSMAKSENNKREYYYFGGKKVEFITRESQALTLSASCINTKSKELECEAFSILKTIKLSQIEKDQERGSNPGLLLCESIKQKVIFGLDQERNQNVFCQFSDGSIVDSGTLHYYARKNSN